MTEVVEAIETGPLDAGQALAKRIIEDLRLLSSDRIDHAFAIGRLLLQWEQEGLHRHVGHASQDDVIKLVGLKRATAFSNKRLARKFDLAAVRHVGLGKLRLLAANYVDDPASCIYDGIAVPGPDGGLMRVSVEDVSYRQLQALLRANRERGTRGASAAPAVAPELHAALALVLHGLDGAAPNVPAVEPTATVVEVPAEELIEFEEVRLEVEPAASLPLSTVQPPSDIQRAAIMVGASAAIGTPQGKSLVARPSGRAAGR